MSHEALKKKVAELPRAPGVYLMKDEKGQVLYVGKAKSLRNRVASYFQDSPSDDRPRIAEMMRRVADIEVVEAESEVDALLMEARLIKDVQPPYNARMRDSKLFPYLEITLGEDFPGVYVTRRHDDPKSRFFGPFTDARGLRRAVRLLQPVFRFRTCTLDISASDDKRRYQRPCLLYYIERCTGPCADLISRREYRKQIGLLQRFLAGKRKGVIASLNREMRAASKALEFERAARLRDQVKAMESLARRGDVDYFPEATAPPVLDPREGLHQMRELFDLPDTPRAIDGVDVSHLSGSDSVGSLVTFLDGKPHKGGYRRYRIKAVEGIDDFGMIQEVVRRRFRRLTDEETPFPDLLLVDGGKGQLRAVFDVFRELEIEPPKVVALAKREELLFHGEPPIELRLQRSAPALRILQYVRDEAHRFAVHYHHLLRGKRIRARI